MKCGSSRGLCHDYGSDAMKDKLSITGVRCHIRGADENMAASRDA
jgi:hypothetical protein